MLKLKNETYDMLFIVVILLYWQVMKLGRQNVKFIFEVISLFFLSLYLFNQFHAIGSFYTP